MVRLKIPIISSDIEFFCLFYEGKEGHEVQKINKNEKDWFLQITVRFDEMKSTKGEMEKMFGEMKSTKGEMEKMFEETEPEIAGAAETALRLPEGNRKAADFIVAFQEYSAVSAVAIIP